MAARAASGAVIDVLAARLPNLLGGYADPTPSNNTMPKSAASLQRGNFSGRYMGCASMPLPAS